MKAARQKWFRYLLASLIGFAGSKVLPDSAEWLANVTAVVLGY